MTIHGGDMDELKRLENAARRPVLEWYGWTNLFVIYCLSNPWLVVLGILTPQRQRYFAAGVMLLIVFILVRTYFLLGARVTAGEYAYLRPLGLAVLESPTLDLKRVARTAVEGPWGLIPGRGTVLAGTRHGRSVHVVVDSQRNYTMVEGAGPAVHCREQGRRAGRRQRCPTGDRGEPGRVAQSEALDRYGVVGQAGGDTR